MLNTFIFSALRVIYVQFRLGKNPKQAAGEAPFSASLFLRPEPRDGYAFSRGVESKRLSERIFF